MNCERFVSLIQASNTNDNSTVQTASKELEVFLHSDEALSVIVEVINNAESEIIRKGGYVYLYRYGKIKYNSFSIGYKIVFLETLLNFLKTMPEDYYRNLICQTFQLCLNRNTAYSPLVEYLFENEDETQENALYRMKVANILFDIIPLPMIVEHAEAIFAISNELFSVIEDPNQKIDILHLVIMTISSVGADKCEEMKEIMISQFPGIFESFEQLDINGQLAFASILGSIIVNYTDVFDQVFPTIAQLLESEVNVSVKFVVLSSLTEAFKNGSFEEEFMVSIVDKMIKLFTENLGEDDSYSVYIEQMFENLCENSLANLKSHILELCSEMVDGESADMLSALCLINYGIERFIDISSEFFAIYKDKVYPQLEEASEPEPPFIIASLNIIMNASIQYLTSPVEYMQAFLQYLFSDNQEIRQAYIDTLSSVYEEKTLKPLLIEFLSEFPGSEAEPDGYFVSAFSSMISGSSDLEEELIRGIYELSLAFYGSCNEENMLLSPCIDMFGQIISNIPALYEPIMEQISSSIMSLAEEMTSDEFADVDVFSSILLFFTVILDGSNEESPLLAQEETTAFLQWILTNEFQNPYLESRALLLKIIYITVAGLVDYVPVLLSKVFDLIENMKIEEIVIIAPKLPKFCQTLAKDDILKIIQGLFRCYSSADCEGIKITILSVIPELLNLFGEEDYPIVDPLIDEHIGELLGFGSMPYFNVALNLLSFGLMRRTEKSLEYLKHIVDEMIPLFTNTYYECFLDHLFDWIAVHGIPDEFIPELVAPLASIIGELSGGIIQTYVCLINKLIQNYESGMELFGELIPQLRGWEESENVMILDNLSSLYLTVAAKTGSLDEEMLSFALSHYPPTDQEELESMSECILQITFPESIYPLLVQSLTNALSNEEIVGELGEERSEALRQLLAQLSPQ